jgi:hypothetical protein
VYEPRVLAYSSKSTCQDVGVLVCPGNSSAGRMPWTQLGFSLSLGHARPQHDLRRATNRSYHESRRGLDRTPAQASTQSLRTASRTTKHQSSLVSCTDWMREVTHTTASKIALRCCTTPWQHLRLLPSCRRCDHAAKGRAPQLVAQAV